MTQKERDRLVTLKKAEQREITQVEATKKLGFSPRQVARILVALKQKGDKGVLHGLKGRKIE